MFKNGHIGLIKEKVLKLFESNLSGWVFTGQSFEDLAEHTPVLSG